MGDDRDDDDHNDIDDGEIERQLTGWMEEEWRNI